MTSDFKRENIYKLSALCNMRKKRNFTFFSYNNFYLNFSFSITSTIISFQLENKKEWTKAEYIDFLKHILEYEYKYGFLKNFWISEKYIDLSIENTVDISKNFWNNLAQLISLLEYHHKCIKKWIQDSDSLAQKIEKFHTPEIRKILLNVFRENIPSFFSTKIKDSNDNNLKNILGHFMENHYRIWKFDIYGLDKKWYRRDGFKQEKNAYNFHKNGTTYDDEWFNSLGYDKSGYNRSGYNLEGFNRDGYRMNGYDALGYDRSGYNSEGYDKQGFDKNGYNSKWFDRNGFTREGYNSLGFDRDGYDKSGYDKSGFHKTTGLHKNGDKYNYEGYDINGYDRSGYDKNGFNKSGYNKSWFDKNGLDRGWFDINGYNIDGFNREWFDRSGYNKKGDYNKEFDLRLQWITTSQNTYIPQETPKNDYSHISWNSQSITTTTKEINAQEKNNIVTMRIWQAEYGKFLITLIVVSACILAFWLMTTPALILPLLKIFWVWYVYSNRHIYWRLNDFDYSKWWSLLVVIPIVWILFVIIVYFIPWTNGPNKYGPKPQ